MLQPFHRLTASLLIPLFLTSPLLAQQHRSTPAKPPAAEAPAAVPSFDTLLAADSYKIYCEVRGVGGLIRSTAVTDLLDPVMKLGGPPKEFKALVRWLNAHSDALAGSRMMVAGWPSRPNLPSVLVAIEFASPEEAKKFFPEFRDFLPIVLPTATPTPVPSPTPAESAKATSKSTSAVTTETAGANVGPGRQGKLAAENDNTPPAPPYQMKQVGSLVLLSDKAFTFRNLNPRGSKPLDEDANFLLARNRFASESVFLYVDLKSIEKEEQERQKAYEAEEQKRLEAEARNPAKPEESPATEEPEIAAPDQPLPSPEPEVSVAPEQAQVPEPQISGDTPASSEPNRGTDAMSPLIYSLYGALFRGQSKYPEAISVALVFEGDAYVVRTLIINGTENKSNAIPFVPQFLSGPAIVPESPNIFPADTELFVSVSLDYPQIYDGLLKAMAHAEEQMRKYSREPIPEGPAREAPFAAYEKQLGIKIKDDLLPLLGNELAFALPRKAPTAVPEASPSPPPPDPKSSPTPSVPVQNPDPVVAISIKDREAVQKLIPRIIEGFGLKGANMLAQTEKRDGTELVSYAGMFSYAFINDFLVLSPDAKETRRVVDAYLNHQTLASDSHFRNSTRWQPRQVQGQAFMSSRFAEQFLTGGGGYGANLNEKTSEFLSRINPAIDPLTYALTNDGLGPLHEIHIPKSLLMLQVVSISAQASESLPASNEAVAKSVMRSVASAEAAYRATENSYGTIDQLVSAGFLSRDMLEKHGYRINVSASKDKFEITAVPVEYGQTGKLSYFLDESQVLRGGDHGGGAATVADQPLE